MWSSSSSFPGSSGWEHAAGASVPAPPTSSFPSSLTAGGDRKTPENYFWTYRKRGLYALGIVRAVRNIAMSHATDYVADGTFRAEESVHAYFLGAFPWLVGEVIEAAKFGGIAL